MLARLNNPGVFFGLAGLVAPIGFFEVFFKAFHLLFGGGLPSGLWGGRFGRERRWNGVDHRHDFFPERILAQRALAASRMRARAAALMARRLRITFPRGFGTASIIRFWSSV